MPAGTLFLFSYKSHSVATSLLSFRPKGLILEFALIFSLSLTTPQKNASLQVAGSGLEIETQDGFVPRAVLVTRAWVGGPPEPLGPAVGFVSMRSALTKGEL